LLTSGLSTILTGVFLFLFVAKARTTTSVLGFNCATALTQNLMYGVLYAYTPEVLPSVHRGTGSGIAACFNRICGLMAPIIGAYLGTTGPTILYVSASLFLVAGVLMTFLPFESRGKASI
jgi:MFS family permease